MTRLIDAILAGMALEWAVLAIRDRDRAAAAGLQLGAGGALLHAWRASRPGPARASALALLALSLGLHLGDLRAGGRAR